MSYKIVVDSCCELPEEWKKDSRFEIVPLTLIVGDSYEKEDDADKDKKSVDEVENDEEEKFNESLDHYRKLNARLFQD